MNYRRLIGKAEAIIATGMPGLYRVLAFMAVERVYSLSDLGRAASAFSIAQILGFFTAIGWASLILVRVPAASEGKDRIQRFYELFGMALVSMLIVAAGMALWIKFFHPNISGYEITIILVGWTFYQLARHYFLAHRAYGRVIGYDVFLVGATAVLIPSVQRFGSTAGVPLGMALGITGGLMLLSIGPPAVVPRVIRFEMKGLEFGFTNFLSGGVALSLVPIARLTDGARFAGVISLVASFSAISALIPRAISMYRLPELSKLAGADGSLRDLTLKTAREIALACGGTFLVNAIIVAGIMFYEGDGDHFWYGLVCGLAICAQGCISMLSMAYSSVMMVREESRESMLINLLSCGLFVAALSAFYFANGEMKFPFVLTICIFVTVVRNLIIKRRSVPLLASVSRSS